MKKHLTLSLLTSLLLAVVAWLPLAAQAQQMNYQGRLTDTNGTALADGQFTLTFNLYAAASGGTAVWGPFVCDSTAGNGHAAKADLVSGRFNVILGPLDTASRPLPPAFAGGTPRYLGIKVGAGSEIAPRQQILAAPEALHAVEADHAATADNAANATHATTANTAANFTSTVLFTDEVNQRVGVGTASPGSRLVVQGDAPANIYQLRLQGTTDTARQLLLGYNTTDNYGIIQPAEQGIAFRNLILNPFNGNVGIGTASPAYRLHVQDPGAETGRIHVGSRSASGAAKLISFGDGDYVTIGENGADDRMELTAGTFVFNNGNIGIGTSTPTHAKVDIIGTANSYTVGTYGWLNSGGSGGNHGGGTFGGASLYASGSIVGQGFLAFSDERIKRIEGRSDAARDLATLQAIEVTDYSYIDILANGKGKHKKVIAQQIEKVYPQAVIRTTDVVPDIYQKATIQDGWVKLATSLKKGERVRLIGEKKEGIHEVLEVVEGKFRTGFAADGNVVFVYGREVKDFRTVDYEAIAMLNVSATQELAKRVEKLETRESHLAELEQKATRVATLEREVADLKKMVTQLAEAGKAPKQTVVLTPQTLPTGAEGSLQGATQAIRASLDRE